VNGLLALAGGGVMAVTLMACYGAPSGEGYFVCTNGQTTDDKDHDGYTCDDCDDDNANIHPNALDLLGDGIDQNCDGVDGEADADAGADADADGGSCLHCPQAFAQLASGGTVDPSKLCTTSQTPFDALRSCACDTGCAAVCGDNVCKSMKPNADCGSCIQTTCATQAADCQADQ
jgi:hypothetical protein